MKSLVEEHVLNISAVVQMRHIISGASSVRVVSIGVTQIQQSSHPNILQKMRTASSTTSRLLHMEQALKIGKTQPFHPALNLPEDVQMIGTVHGIDLEPLPQSSTEDDPFHDDWPHWPPPRA